jgi:hypothetical protein
MYSERNPLKIPFALWYGLSLQFRSDENMFLERVHFGADYLR